MHRRILLAILLAVAVTGCALGIPLGFAAVTVVESLARQDLAQRAQRVATALDNRLAERRPLDLERFRFAVPGGGRIVAQYRTGRAEYGTDPGRDPVMERVPLVRGGSVAVAEPSGPLRDRQARVTGYVVLLVLFSVGTGTVVATVTARRLARPLRHVADRAARLGAGDFRADPGRYGVSELDMVAETLDSSAGALAGLMQRERDLVGDVSHQLRSRLTAVQLRIEGLAESADEDTAAEANAALEQTEALGTALDELLAASRAARALEAEPVDLGQHLRAIAGEWRPVLRDAGRALRLTVPDGTLAVATPARLREAVGVLLDNAVRHGAGEVSLSARREESAVVVQVGDAGPGVPDELAPHVFERGVSGGGSTGVGLALARALVDADGGRLELSAARPATFSVFLLVPEPPGRTPEWRSGPR